MSYADRSSGVMTGRRRRCRAGDEVGRFPSVGRYPHPLAGERRLRPLSPETPRRCSIGLHRWARRWLSVCSIGLACIDRFRCGRGHGTVRLRAAPPQRQAFPTSPKPTSSASPCSTTRAGEFGDHRQRTGARQARHYCRDLHSPSPTRQQSIWPKVSPQGIHIVDAPVSGGAAAAAKGERQMVGADDESVPAG